MAKATNARNISTRIVLEGEKEFKASLAETDKSLSTLRSEMALVDAEFKGQANSAEALQAKHDVLNKQYSEQAERIQKLNKHTEELNKQNEKSSKRLAEVQEELADLGISAEDLGKYYKKARDNSEDLTDQQKKLLKESESLERTTSALGEALYKNGKDINYSQAKLLELNRELQKTDGYLDEAKNSADKCASSIDGFGREVKDAGDDLGGSGGLLGKLGDLKGILAGGAIVAGAKAVGDAIIGIVDDTAEYRKVMGTLEVSSQQAGYTAEQTAEAYQRLYGVLGDTQTAATTVANLQAIGLSQSDLITMLDAATGAWATYGDSIPIDGLSEAINETIQTGKVTGTFADVLNWAGVSEDAFNEKLAAANSTAARAQIVLGQLAKQNLPDAGQAWRDANGDLIAYNESQGKVDDAMAKLGERLAPVAAGIKNTFAGAVNVAIDTVEAWVGALQSAVSWLDKVTSASQRADELASRAATSPNSRTAAYDRLRGHLSGDSSSGEDDWRSSRRSAADVQSEQTQTINIKSTIMLDGRQVGESVSQYQQRAQRAYQ